MMSVSLSVHADFEKHNVSKLVPHVLTTQRNRLLAL
jgi:hypothetical protein